MPKRLRLMRGRVVMYVEPRDIWIGVYIAEEYVCVCPLPLLVIRWSRNV